MENPDEEQQVQGNLPITMNRFPVAAQAVVLRRTG